MINSGRASDTPRDAKLAWSRLRTSEEIARLASKLADVRTMISDLKFAEALSVLLRPHGEVRIEYFTAEMQPFSNQQKPDIVFLPFRGPFARQITFIEIKLSDRALSTNRAVQIIGDRKQFVQEALEDIVTRYVVVTALKVPETTKKVLEKQRVQVLDQATTPEEIASILE